MRHASRAPVCSQTTGALASRHLLACALLAIPGHHHNSTTPYTTSPLVIRARPRDLGRPEEPGSAGRFRGPSRRSSLSPPGPSRRSPYRPTQNRDQGEIHRGHDPLEETRQSQSSNHRHPRHIMRGLSSGPTSRVRRSVRRPILARLRRADRPVRTARLGLPIGRLHANRALCSCTRVSLPLAASLLSPGKRGLVGSVRAGVLWDGF